MDLLLFYLLSLCLPILLVLGRRSHSSFFRQYFVYPDILPRTYLFGPLTRLQAIFYLVYLAITLLANLLQVRSLTTASSRACGIILINLLFLSSSMSLEFISNLANTPPRTQIQLHSAMGCVVYAEAILHSILVLHKRSFDLKDQRALYGIVVGTARCA